MGFSKGFTLIEVMIVVAIILMLAAVALPAYRDYESTSVEISNTEVDNCIDVELDRDMSTIQQLAVLQVCEDLYGG